METVAIHRYQFRCHEVYLVREKSAWRTVQRRVWSMERGMSNRTKGHRVRDGRGRIMRQQCRLMKEGEREREQIYVTS